MTQLVLSIFPGIGMLDRAFEEEGFCVVRGPDLLWGGDVHSFHPPADRFDGVIGGSPCQAFSRMRHIVEANGYKVAPNLIPEFERIVLEVAPEWFVMENVPDAPEPRGALSCALIQDSWVGGLTSRMRRFSFGGAARRAHALIEVLPLHTSEPLRAVVRDAREIPVAVGGSGKLKARRGGGGAAPHEGKRLSVAEMLRRQGFRSDLLDDCPLTEDGKRGAVGNGVPLPMGRAIARAVRVAIGMAEPSMRNTEAL